MPDIEPGEEKSEREPNSSCEEDIDLELIVSGGNALSINSAQFFR